MHTVAVIVGSTRKDSINRKLAEALRRLAADKLDLRLVRIDDLPLFNQDDENESLPSVTRFKQEVQDANAVLFVTPEHNRSIPAALKNAFDWGSRPRGANVWINKPAAIIGASRGRLSTAVAQQHLRSIVSGHFSAVLGSPEAFIQYTDDLIGNDGDIAKDDARAFLQRFVDNFAKLISALVEAGG